MKTPATLQSPAYPFVLNPVLLADRWISRARGLVRVYVNCVRIGIDVIVVSAGSAGAGCYLRVSVDGITRLLRRGLGNDFHRVDVTVDDRRTIVEPTIQQIFFAHFLEG